MAANIGPNPECPSFMRWPGVAAHQRQRQAPERPATPVRLGQGLMATVPAELREPLEDPLATSRMGVTLAGLRRIRAALLAHFGAPRFAHLSTAEVNSLWVQPLTRARRCRLLELPPPEGPVLPGDVAQPMYFISHAWKNRACRLFDYVLSFLEDAGDDVAVWIDILAVTQHADSPQQRHDVSAAAFAATVAGCGGGTLVVLDREMTSPATRGWCIFEWASTLSVHGSDGFHMQLAPADRHHVFGSIAVRSAECFKQADKDMILGLVEERYGSCDLFDAKLRLQVLLEPLSYRVDVRKLAARAGGTHWHWEPLRRWLEAGGGPSVGDGSSSGSSRLLCVVGGAGEGKSTVSAQLAAAAAGGSSAEGVEDSSAGQRGSLLPPGCAVAYHFLKYSDARRLDPVRMIKSIAFQLAEKLPEVRAVLLGLDVKAVAALQEPEKAFQMLLLQPLVAFQGALLQGRASTSQPILILIDALDEADPLEQQLAAIAATAATAAAAGANGSSTSSGGGRGSGEPGVSCPTVCGNKALEVLTTLLPRLPSCVRFMATTRPDAATGQVLPALHRAFGGAVTLLQPSALRAPATGSSSSEAAGGVMVYYTIASAVAGGGTDAEQLLLPGGRAPMLSDAHALLRRVFEAAYARLEGGGVQGSSSSNGWRAQSANVTATQVTELIAVIMAAKEPLSHSLVQQLGLGGAVPALPGHPVLFGVEDHHLHMVHKTLGEWLLNPSASGAFAVCLAAGHARLGLHLARLWQRHSQAPAEASKAPATAPTGSSTGTGETEATVALFGASSSSLRYTLKYAAAHLVAAANAAATAATTAAGEDTAGATAGGQQQCRLALEVLVGDFGFLRAVVAAGCAPDLIGALAALAAPSPLCHDVLRWLRAEQDRLQALAAAAEAAGSGSGGAGAVDPDAGSSGSSWVVGQVLATTPISCALHRLAAAAYRGHDWRCVSVLPRSLQSWPPCMAVLQANDASSQPRRSGPPAGPPTASPGLECVQWSPDGKQLATAGNGGDVRVWDAATGRQLAALRPHHGGGSIRGLSYCRAGGRQIALTTSRIALILDTATGGEVAQLTEQGAASSPQAADPHLGFNGGTAIAYSADGRLIALVEDNSAKRQLSLWEVTESPASASSASVAVAQQLQHGSSSTSTGSSSGSQQQVRVRRLARLPGYRCAAFSPDGRRLVANNGELGEMNGTGDRSLVVYDVEELRRRADAPPVTPAPAPAAAGAAAAGGSGLGPWSLEPLNWEGRRYLLHRASGAVYAGYMGPDTYPQLLGRWRQPETRLEGLGGSGAADEGCWLELVEGHVLDGVFGGLDRYLKENRVRFSAMFEAFDADRSGTLEAEELAKLVKKLVPGVSSSEIKYIMAIIDSNEDRSVTQREFLEATRMWVVAARRVAEERRAEAGVDKVQAGASGGTAAMLETSEVKAALRLVTDHCRANPAAARAAFRRHVTAASARPSTNGTSDAAPAAAAAAPGAAAVASGGAAAAASEGRLDPRELARLLLDCVPGLSEQQLRFVMTHMSQLDLKGDGMVSFDELLFAVRAEQAPAQHKAADAPAPAPSPLESLFMPQAAPVAASNGGASNGASHPWEALFGGGGDGGNGAPPANGGASSIAANAGPPPPVLLTLSQAHSNSVMAVDYSPDGRFIATGSYDESAAVWDATTGALLARLRTPNDTAAADGSGRCVKCVAWSPRPLSSVAAAAGVAAPEAAARGAAGAMPLLAVGTIDGVVRVWEPRSGTCVSSLRGHTNEVTAVAWAPLGPGPDATAAAPDGQGLLLASVSRDGTARLWEVSAQVLESAAAAAAAVAAAAPVPTNPSESGTEADAEQARRDAEQQPAGELQAVAVSRCGGVIATGGQDRRLRLWDVASGRLLHLLERPWSSSIACVAFAPDGRTVAAGHDDATVRVWRVGDGTVLSEVEHRGREVRGLAYSSDGATLAAVCKGNRISLWRVAAAGAAATGAGDGGELPAGAVGAKALALISTAGDYATAYSAVAWSPCGTRLYCSNYDGDVHEIDVAARTCTANLSCNKSGLPWVTGVAASGDGRWVAAAVREAGLVVFDAASRERVDVAAVDDPGTTFCVAFSRDSRMLLTAGSEGVAVWECCAEGKAGAGGGVGAVVGVCWRRRAQLKGHVRSVLSASWGADSRRVVSAGVDGAVRVWEQLPTAGPTR